MTACGFSKARGSETFTSPPCGPLLRHSGKLLVGVEESNALERLSQGLSQLSQRGMALPLLREAGKGGEQHSLHWTVLPRGSALANMISQFSLALFLFLYIFCKKLHQATWGGKG